jgi:DNA recombination-dependent growth factor C
MGIEARSLSLIRYRVKGEIEGNFWDTVEQGVRRGAFKQCEIRTDIAGAGWTAYDDFTNVEFPGSSYAHGNYVVLSLRVDTVRVPGRILEIELKERTKKILEDSGRTRLSSAQRRELKEAIKQEFLKKAFPSIQVHDVVWDTASGVVYFTGTSTKARERLEEYFKKCFGLSIVPLIPYLRAEEVLQDRGIGTEQLEKMTASSFIP